MPAQTKAQRAMQLRLEGLTYAKVGKILGISRQRAQQLTQAPANIRKTVMQRANSKCEVCGLVLMASGHVHHKSTEYETPNDYNAVDNLQYLCLGCHRKAHPVNGKIHKCRAADCSRETNRPQYCSDECRNREGQRRYNKKVRKALRHLEASAEVAQ